MSRPPPLAPVNPNLPIQRDPERLRARLAQVADSLLEGWRERAPQTRGFPSGHVQPTGQDPEGGTTRSHPESPGPRGASGDEGSEDSPRVSRRPKPQSVG